MRCRDILCDQSRYLIYDATCGMLDNLTSDYLCFDLFIKMTPTGNISIVPQTIDKYMLYKVIPQSRHIQLLFPESSPVSTIFNYFLVHIIRYGDEWFVMKIEKLHNSKVKMNVSGILTEFYVEIGLFEVSENALYDEVFVTNQENTSKVDVFRTTKLEVTPYSKSVCPPKRSYTFDRLLYCPFIKLGFDELTVTMENGFLSFWRKSLILITLLKWQYRLTGEGFLICLEDYLLINNALPDAVTFDGPENESVSGQVGPKRMLSFICVCLSLVCLFITITVYVRFSELRSQPGVNNLILCSCLLCAQAVYQFAAGQQNHSQAACAVVGAICHFLWLTVMFALNSCSLQMFMIFRSHARLLSSYNTRTTVVTILYVVGSSLLFVVVNIVVSLTRSSGGDIGYGGNVCFITACDMHIITFIIPSFILIIVNFLLFVIVLYKMREFNIVSSRLNQERSYLRINARLSTLTGLTWLFGFIQILVRNDVLEYLFIILNASQGLFIMVAFICNQRVYSLIFKTSTRTSLDVAVVTKQSSIPN